MLRPQPQRAPSHLKYGSDQACGSGWRSKVSKLSAFHRTPGRFILQPLPYWALGQVSPSCQLFSQISNIACVSHGRKLLVFSKLVISRAQLLGAGPKSLGVHEVELKPFAPWAPSWQSHGAEVRVCRELVFQLLLLALMGAFFPSPRSFWSQLLGVFYSYFFRGRVSHVAIDLVCLWEVSRGSPSFGCHLGKDCGSLWGVGRWCSGSPGDGDSANVFSTGDAFVIYSKRS